jgi:cation diffusion facilitator CzcD-associated flavoprotein CzcO
MDHIRFNTTVSACTWLEKERIWKIETTQGTYYARFLLNAQGFLADPKLDLPGLENFKGKAFHSAQWDHNYNLRGKNVVVIGTGASAIQFVPGIVNKVKKLTIFQRSAPTIIPRDDYEIPSWMKWLFRNLPFTLTFVRGCIYWTHEGYILNFLYRLPTEKLLGSILKYYRDCQVTDPNLRKIIEPNYAPGCKRIMVSNDWYPAITRPNVRIIPQSAKCFDETGVIAADGTHVECDCVILGTGFETQKDELDSNFVIKGRNGITMDEFWKKEGGMKAYKGVTIPNFPNYFLFMGPNTNLGHNSVIFMIEQQIHYIIQALKTCVGLKRNVVEIKREPFDKYNEMIQKSLAKSVWNTGNCTSWYLSGKGFNSSIWGKGFTFLYKFDMKKFDRDNYTMQ